MPRDTIPHAVEHGKEPAPKTAQINAGGVNTAGTAAAAPHIVRTIAPSYAGSDKLPKDFLYRWNDAISDAAVSRRCKTVMRAVYAHMNGPKQPDHGSAYLKHRVIAAECGYKQTKSVQLAIREAERAGLLLTEEWLTEYGEHRATWFHAVVPVAAPKTTPVPAEPTFHTPRNRDSTGGGTDVPGGVESTFHPIEEELPVELSGELPTELPPYPPQAGGGREADENDQPQPHLAEVVAPGGSARDAISAALAEGLGYTSTIKLAQRSWDRAVAQFAEAGADPQDVTAVAAALQQAGWSQPVQPKHVVQHFDATLAKLQRGEPIGREEHPIDRRWRGLLAMDDPEQAAAAAEQQRAAFVAAMGERLAGGTSAAEEAADALSGAGIPLTVGDALAEIEHPTGVLDQERFPLAEAVGA